MNKRTKYEIFDLIVFIIATFAAFISFCGFIMFYLNIGSSNLSEVIINIGIGIYVALFLAQFPFYIVTIVCSIITEESLSKHNMKIKLAYIPFFILNVFVCILAFIESATINIFLAPIVLILFISTTYLIMFRTSLSNLIYFIKKYTTKKLNVTPWGIISLVLSFFFVFDIISGIILYNHESNQNPEKKRVLQEKFAKRVSRRIIKWENKKHLHSSIYVVISIASSVILYVSTFTLLGFFGDFIDYIKAIDATLLDMAKEPAFTISISLIALSVLVRFISGIIYGKYGDKDIIGFVSIMKLVNLLPSIILLALAVILLFIGSVFGAFAIIFLPVIPVVIFAIFIVVAAGISSVSLTLGNGFLFVALLSVWSELTIYVYYRNQRIVTNRKFANGAVVACLVLLWFPILDIPALFTLKSLSKKGKIFGDTPLIENLDCIK